MMSSLSFPSLHKIAPVILTEAFPKRQESEFPAGYDREMGAERKSVLTFSPNPSFNKLWTGELQNCLSVLKNFRLIPNKQANQDSPCASPSSVTALRG
jgi:hypothetical protein